MSRRGKIPLMCDPGWPLICDYRATEGGLLIADERVLTSSRHSVFAALILEVYHLRNH